MNAQPEIIIPPDSQAIKSFAYIPVRGVHHYYEWICDWEQSPGEALIFNQPILVFLHGWAGSAKYWQGIAQALANQFHCLLYDLRGFGRSHLPRPIPPEVAALGYELESYAEDLAVLLDALGLERVSLIAHSTGASIAIRFINRYPERVGRAILTCNGVFECDEKAFQAFHQFGSYVVRFRPSWLLHIPFVDHLFMARFLHRPLPNTVKRAFLEDFLMADYEAALGTIYTAVSKKAAEEMPGEFARLTLPTLLISGEQDKIIPAEMGRQAAVLNKNIQHIIIPNTAHFPMLEDTQTYLQLVSQFLQMEKN